MINNFYYNIVYIIMLSSFFTLSMQGITLKDKVLGILITLVNALIFWRG